MEIPVSLAQLLARLNLDDAEIDLNQILDDLRHALLGTVDSFLGLTITMTVAGLPITVSSLSGDPPSLSSLRLPLPALTATDPDSIVYLFASRAGAFVDLAADLGVALGLTGAALLLDADLDRSRSVPAGMEPAEASVVNQAIGTLIDRGFTPEGARTHLQSMAEVEGLSVSAVAQGIVGSTKRSASSGEE